MTKELLEQAKKDYPIGTKYRCLKDGTLGVSISLPETCGDAIYSTFKGKRTSSGSLFNQYLYCDGQWAEIISLPIKQLNYYFY